MAEEPKTPELTSGTTKAPVAAKAPPASGAKKPPSGAGAGAPKTARPPGTPKYGGKPQKEGSIALIPFIFIGFLAGGSSVVSAVVLYIYEIIQNNKKNEWPGWSGLDALNYMFFADYPYFFSGGILYNAYKVKVFSFHAEALTRAVNWIVYTYLDCSIVFLCLLNGVILLTLSVRTALFRLNKEGGG